MDIQTLTDHIARKMDMSTDAVESALDTYITQIENLDNREINRDEINKDDAEFLAESIKQAQAAGDLGHRELAHLEYTVGQIAQLESERDPQIRAARAAGVTVKQIMAATGLSRARVYGILGEM